MNTFEINGFVFTFSNTDKKMFINCDNKVDYYEAEVNDLDKCLFLKNIHITHLLLKYW